MGIGLKQGRAPFSVPETWRRISKRGEQQGTGRFDVLVCGHVVPASDTPYRRFRPCPECRAFAHRFAQDHARRSGATQAA